MTAPTMTSPGRQALLDQLEADVLDLQRSDAWADYLAAQARFHRYSPRNVMLISMQRPEATHVAGFTTWRSLGRQVRRGEKAISILAPMVVADEEGGRVVRGFRWVNVFDIAQTDGDELPAPVRSLDGEDPAELREGLVEVARGLGLAVLEEPLSPGVNGELRWRASTIVVAPGHSGPQRAKTLAHELGHFLLHRHELDRARAEIEAEAVAYVVLASLGVDSTPYSAGYLSSWIGEGQDVSAAIRRSIDAISSASQRIIDLLERRQAKPAAALDVAS